MMIRLAEGIGFCFGVKRAVAMAEAALKKNTPIYSLGSIIHNRQVVESLGAKGLKVIKDFRNIKGGMVIISSHGISPKIASAISKRGIKIIDTTCPFVLNAQEVVKSLSGDGYDVVIVGEANHPEIKALVDFVPKKVFVVKDRKEAKALKIPRNHKISILSQTTQSTDNFLEVVKSILEHKPKEIKIVDTICRDAETRQKRARRLARRVDIMLIVGGKDSANTRRLFEVCRKILKKSYHVESEGDLKKEWFRKRQVIGITSGASTPDWVIQKVIDKINSKFAF